MSKVLLVEDVDVLRTVLRKFLESAGHVVTEASGGDEAGRLAASTRFDVVITDLWMKDGNGLDFIRAQSRSGEATKIVAMTGGDPTTTGARSIEAALTAGASVVLIKPVRKADILAAVATVA